MRSSPVTSRPTRSPTDRALAFMDINPATRGHALVIPKKHAADLIEIAPDELAALLSARPHCGARTGQTRSRRRESRERLRGGCVADRVPFPHPCVPHYAGRDGLEMPWIPTPGDPVEIAEAGALLR